MQMRKSYDGIRECERKKWIKLLLPLLLSFGTAIELDTLSRAVCRVCVLSIRCNGLALTLTLTDTLSPRNTRWNWRCDRLALPDGQQPEEFKRYRSHIDCTLVYKQKVNRGRGAVKMCNADLYGQTHVGVDRVQTACDCDAITFHSIATFFNANIKLNAIYPIKC